MPTNTTIEVRVEQLKAARLNLQEFDSRKPDKLVRMAFHPDFTGDRVYAFVAGLQSMVNHAFDHRREFLFLDDLPTAQFIYNSARNIETAAYLLQQSEPRMGSPISMLTNPRSDIKRILLSIDGGNDRLTGRIIESTREQRSTNAKRCCPWSCLDCLPASRLLI